MLRLPSLGNPTTHMLNEAYSKAYLRKLIKEIQLSFFFVKVTLRNNKQPGHSNYNVVYKNIISEKKTHNFTL